jgi:TonB family protein
MNWGRRVLLPAEADAWPGALRRSVLLHEQAHVARGDFFWHVVIQLGECLYWFHPLVRLGARVAMREAERATDDAVLAGGVEPADYASHLIRVARQMRPAPEAALAVARPSTLEGRIRSILTSGANRRPVGRGTALALVLVAVVALVPLAALGQKENKVHKVGDGVTAPRLISKVEPQYTEEARDAKIEGVTILTVEVTEAGTPENIKVKVSLDPGLDLNAIAALSQWRFDPATKDGKPVRVGATVEVNFRLM